MPKAPPIHRPLGKRKTQRAARKDDYGARLTRQVHNSARWRYEVQPAHLRREPLCRMCKESGRVTVADHVDHITPIRDGGAPFDPSNLRSLCHPHHSSVTRRWQDQRDPEPSSPPPGPAYVIA